jgi:hypothetical protein
MSSALTSTMNGKSSVRPSWLTRLVDRLFKPFATPVSGSLFDAHSTEITLSGIHGPTPIDVLDAIYHDGPLSLQSDFARSRDKDIAALASVGVITSVLNGMATRQWRLTAAGFDLMESA